jgi:hypothetical protein
MCLGFTNLKGFKSVERVVSHGIPPDMYALMLHLISRLGSHSVVLLGALACDSRLHKEKARFKEAGFFSDSAFVA